MQFCCAICTDSILQSEDIDVTQCGHVFHVSCLQTWLNTSSTCPECRDSCTRSRLIRLYLNHTLINDTFHSNKSLKAQLRDSEVKIIELQDSLSETQETHKLAIEGLEQQITTKEFENDVKINELKAKMSDEYEAQKLALAKIENLQQQIKEKTDQLKKSKSEAVAKVQILEASLSKARETQEQALKTIEGLKQEITNKALQLQNFKHENDVKNVKSPIRELLIQNTEAMLKQLQTTQIVKSTSSLSDVRGVQLQNADAGDVERPSHHHPSSLVLDGLPTLHNVNDCENLTDLVIRMANLIRVNLTTKDISSCYRLSAGNKTRSPTVLINFKENSMRDKFFFAYHKKRDVTVRDLIPEHRINNRLYLNEYVTDELVKLLQRRCTELKKKKVIWRYFIKNGKVFFEMQQGESPTLATLQLLSELETQ